MKRIIYILFFSLCCSLGYAQSSLQDAFKAFQSGDLNNAKSIIDGLSSDESMKTDPKYWYIRSYIYKSLYKKATTNTIAQSMKNIAVISILELLKVDKEQKYTKDAKVNLKYFAISYYNDANKLGKEKNFDGSLKAFDEFERLIVMADPSMNVKAKKIEYYLFLGSENSRIYENDNSSKVPFDAAKEYFNKVLTLDPNNVNASFNLAVLYYNEGSNIINMLEYDIDLEALSTVEDRSIAMFKQSLPYMEFVYNKEPNNKDAIKGLSGIYYALKEFDKSNEFKAKLEKE